MKCVVFTNNEKKCKELEHLLSDLSIEVIPYFKECGRNIQVIEDGLTFQINAIKKVQALDFLQDTIRLADDSGLEIDHLMGKPGVFSARYGGKDLTDNQRCIHVLRQMEGVSNRKAQFRSVIALCLPNQKKPVTVEGIVSGTLAEYISGEGGFGYDSIFIPDGLNQSFAECGQEIKDSMSHRGKSIRLAKEKIQAFLEETVISG